MCLLNVFTHKFAIQPNYNALQHVCAKPFIKSQSHVSRQ